MKSFKSPKGFTLVEMSLYVAICAILLLVLSSFLSFLLGARVRSQAITEVNQQGLQIMNIVTQTIRNSRSIQVPAQGLASSTLSVTTGNPLLNPTVFTSASSTMYTKEASGAMVPLTNSRVRVSDLLFQNISSSSSVEKIIRISFTITYPSPEGRDEYSFSKSFSGSATLR